MSIILNSAIIRIVIKNLNWHREVMSQINTGGPTVGIRRPQQAYGASGGLTNDIQLNRGDELLILDRERQDQQEKILEQASSIRSLQLHSKSRT